MGGSVNAKSLSREAAKKNMEKEIGTGAALQR